MNLVLYGDKDNNENLMKMWPRRVRRYKLIVNDTGEIEYETQGHAVMFANNQLVKVLAANL